MKNPCIKECPRRTEICHASCEDYAAYAAWCEERRQERQRQRAEEDALNHGRRKKYAVRMYNESHRKE